jgi:phosphatidylglycerophosphatase A
VSTRWPYQRWLVTFGGAGMSPIAPGTAGSLLATVLLFGLRQWPILSAGAWQGALVVALITTSVVSVALGPWAIGYFGRKDPGPFVLDEVAGIALTLCFQPMIGWRGLWTFAAAFAAFRVFDVLKPWPCPKLERLPAGWGILTDDLAAAVYANIVCQLLWRVLM